MKADTPQSNLLLTGRPGCGKSTLIERLIPHIKGPCTGFVTREIRQSGRRVGFSIDTLDDQHGILAHVDMPSRYRVGRYGVDLKTIDRLAVPAMMPASLHEFVVIDEIGTMECMSRLFCSTLIRILNADNPVVGSIAAKGGTFIESVKQRTDIHLVRVSLGNRDRLLGKVRKSLSKFFD